MISTLKSRKVIGLLAAMGFVTTATAQNSLPVPDGKPAQMDQPVKVYLLMGQSNMLGLAASEVIKRARLSMR